MENNFKRKSNKMDLSGKTPKASNNTLESIPLIFLELRKAVGHGLIMTN